MLKDESGVALGLAVIMIVLIKCTNWQPPEDPILGHGGGGARG